MNIAATNYTPKIFLDRDKNVFEIEGESRPENVYDFYLPVINTLMIFFENLAENIDNKQDTNTTFRANFKLIYFNSSSAKFIADILNIFKLYNNKKGIDFKIYWHFNEDDDDVKEAGEELSEMISLPFNYVMVKE